MHAMVSFLFLLSYDLPFIPLSELCQEGLFCILPSFSRISVILLNYNNPLSYSTSDYAARHTLLATPQYSLFSLEGFSPKLESPFDFQSLSLSILDEASSFQCKQ